MRVGFFSPIRKMRNRRVPGIGGVQKEFCYHLRVIGVTGQTIFSAFWVAYRRNRFSPSDKQTWDGMGNEN